MKLQLQIALRNLLRARRRTTLLTAAIAGVTFFLVLVLSLTQGIRANVIRSATTLLSGHVNVTGFFKPTSSELVPVTLEADRVRRLVEDELPGVSSVVDRTQGFAQVTSTTESLPSLIMGIDIDEETQFERVVQLAPEADYVEGGDPKAIHGEIGRLSEQRTAILFASQAERLEVDVGDPLTIRAETFGGVANTVDVTVVAVLRNVGLLSGFALFLPKDAIRELYDLPPDATGTVMVYLDEPSRAPEAMGTLRKALERDGFDVMEHRPEGTWQKFDAVTNADWSGYRLDLTTWQDQAGFLTWILTAVRSVSFIILLVLVVLIGVGIVNTMVMAVRDRTSEIGTMRAMGAHRGRILGLFMLEALMLGGGAATIGGLLGVGTALAIDAATLHIPIEAVQAILMSDVLHLAPRPFDVAASIVGMTGFVSFAALWPALKAARLTPVDAMRHTD